MLKNIPPIISPELLKILCEMGHSDTIVIADGNFPAESMGKDAKVVRMDGHGVCEILDAILQLFPLDSYVDHPVHLMQVSGKDTFIPEIWSKFAKIVDDGGYSSKDVISHYERFDFYKHATKAYCIVATSEKALYANIILQKGVI